MIPRVRTIALVAVIGFAAALAGCSSGGTAGESPSPDASAETLPPVIVEIDDVAGTTVEVPVGGFIDLTGDDETFAAWEATIADESIVVFIPGGDDGSAQFDPGLEALAVGSTEVTLDNTESSDSVTFTVDVTEG